jgi:hypothetical protein
VYDREVVVLELTANLKEEYGGAARCFAALSA